MQDELRPVKRTAKVVLIGGPDVDARLPLMQRLAVDYEVSAFGSAPGLVDVFAAKCFDYATYPLDRRVRPLADVRTVRRLTTMLHERKPDIVHAFDTKPGVFGCIAARRAGVPVVLSTVTGLGSLYSASGIRTAILRRIYARLQKSASRRADLTIFQNHDDREQLVAARVVDAARTAVILGSGVATDYYAPSLVSHERRMQVRAELQIPADAVLVTMVARVTRTKGVLEFAAAAGAVGSARPRARFLLIGPDDLDSLDRLRDAEKAALRSVVTWPGARGDVREVLAASDVFVLPTAYREGIPRVLLEAASMGLPMVTTDTPGCNEVVAHEQNGMLIGSGDVGALAAAIARLVGDDELRARFGLVSRERAMRLFDLGVVAAQIDEVYQRLLKRAGLAAGRR